MIRILFIITGFIFLLNNASAETFSAALKKAYNDNNVHEFQIHLKVAAFNI